MAVREHDAALFQWNTVFVVEKITQLSLNKICTWPKTKKKKKLEILQILLIDLPIINYSIYWYIFYTSGELLFLGHPYQYCEFCQHP